MSDTKRVYGIDLGTTYSAIAYIDEHGLPVVIKNTGENNAPVIPSVVYVEDSGTVVVGEEAKKESAIEPDRTFSEIKRFMGRPDYVPREIDGVTYSPERVSSLILKKITNYASTSIGSPVEEVVITVPAYFGDSQRAATKAAGEMAGLKVLGTLNEPTAAAICYGVDTDSTDKTVMVFDLGGGTFDVTIITIADNEIGVVMTGGDADLGGRRWDEVLVEYVADQFLSEKGIDLRASENRGDYQALWISCEEAKKTLTGRASAKVPVSCGARMNVEVTLALFDEMTSQLCQRAVQLSRDLVKRAREEKGLPGIDAILLVGGSTKMRQIGKAVQEEFGIEPRLYEPDEAVAKGAALFARHSALQNEVIKRYEEQGINPAAATEEQRNEAIDDAAPIFGLSSGAAIRELKRNIINVLSHSIGVQALNEQGVDTVALMLADQTRLPAEFAGKFKTVEDNQDFVMVRVMENQADVTDTDNLAGWKQLNEEGNNLPVPPHLPKGAPIQVTFSVDSDGKLHVIAEDLTGHNSIDFDIKLSGVVSREEIERARRDMSSIAIS